MTPEPPSIPIVDLHRIPACTSGACQQGRKQCPCPEACHTPLPEVGSMKTSRHYTARLLAIALAIVGAWLYFK